VLDLRPADRDELGLVFAMGRDADGELYALGTAADGDGTVYRIVPVHFRNSDSPRSAADGDGTVYRIVPG